MKDRVTLEVITDVLPKSVPQSPWIDWMAVLENGDKEMTHLTTNCHMFCFFKALTPLVVVLCKTIGNAGFPKGGIKDTLMSAKVFIRGGTSDNSEKETQKEALSRRRVSIVHSANLIAPLPNSPDICVLMPDHLVGKVLIEGIVGDAILVKCIGFEPPSKSGVSILMSLESLLKGVPVRVNDNCLLLGKMDCKT